MREVSNWHWLFLLLLMALEDLRAASSSCQNWNRNHQHRTTSTGEGGWGCLVKAESARGLDQSVWGFILRIHWGFSILRILWHSPCANTCMSSWIRVFLQSVLACHVPILAVVCLAYSVNEKYSQATIMEIEYLYHQNSAIINNGPNKFKIVSKNVFFCLDIHLHACIILWYSLNNCST